MHDKVMRDFNSLPAEAQRQVADFVAFLQQRYRRPGSPQGKPTEWESDPFVGMWRNREDLQDSAEWVRSTRRREWSEPDG